MKNYYEILEVDKSASDEIIKVAYKSLVKKYHPDLKEGIEKNIAEEKIKIINEAYDILSNPVKREKYNKTLINENISAEQYNLILNENINLKKQINYLKNNYSQVQNNNYCRNYAKQPNYNYTEQKTQNYSNNQNINYENNNNNFIKNIFNDLGEKFKTLIAVVLTFLIIFIILNIPFIREFIFNVLGNGYIFFIIILFFCYIYFLRNKH